MPLRGIRLILAENQKTVDPPYRKRQVLTEHLRKIERYNILRLKSELSGPLVAYVKCDLDENRLRGLLRNVKNFSNSGEYSVFSGSYYGKHVNFLGTGSGPASLLTALFELQSSKLTAILRIGACGGLANATTNRIVVSEGALCADVVSAALAGTDHVYADGMLVGELASALDDERVENLRKLVVSVDAMYLFERNIRKAERKGAYCWDLESATILAFGKVFHLPTASLLQVVSDRKGNSMRSYPPIRRLDFVKSALNALTAH
jgi:uridine phosphorylase